jgi:hypothetical protein
VARRAPGRLPDSFGVLSWGSSGAGPGRLGPALPAAAPAGGAPAGLSFRGPVETDPVRGDPGRAGSEGSAASPSARRVLCQPDALGAARGLSRWRWTATAAWGLSTAAALWLQDRADNAYDEYRTSGSLTRRESAFERAEDYDRAVVGAWILSEACFALGVKAWLDARAGGAAP